MTVFAIHQHESAIGTLVVPPHPEPLSHFPPHPIPLACLRAPALGSLLHALNWHWSSVLYMVMYMFQCYTLKSSHPCLLPLSPKVSLHLCLLCCPACRIIITILLNSIYICVCVYIYVCVCVCVCVLIHSICREENSNLL